MTETLCGGLVTLFAIVFFVGDSRTVRRDAALKKLSNKARAAHYAGVKFDKLLPHIEKCLDLGASDEDIKAVLEEVTQ